MNVFDLVATLTLDSSGFDKGANEAEGKSQSLGSKIKSGLGTAGKIAAGALVAAGTAAVAVSKAFMDGVNATAQYGDHIDKMSQKLGISATAYQEWDAILQHSGTSIDSMQRGMMTLSKAAENGSDAFEKLGISQEDVASMSQEDLFGAVIKGLQGMEEGSERAVLAQELLGGAAKELGPLLNTSAEDTEAMRQAVHDLGGVMSDDAVKAAAAYQDSLQDMQTAFGGLKNNLFSQFLPSVTTVMDGLAAIFSGDTDGGMGMISEGITELTDGIIKAMPQIIQVAGGIIRAIGGAILDNLPEILSMGFEIVLQLITGIIAAIPEIIAALPEIFTAMKDTFVENWPAMKEAGMQLLTMLAEGIESALGSAVSTISGKLSEWVSIAGEKITEFGQRIQEGFMTFVGEVGGWINDNIITPMRDAIAGVIDIGQEIVDKIKQGIQNAWSGLVSWFEGIWNSLFGNRNVNVGVTGSGGGQSPKAIGMDFVPYNDYPALLHRGEAVLTAREADEWRRGESGSGGGVININQVIQAVAQTPVELASATAAYFEQARWAI